MDDIMNLFRAGLIILILLLMYVFVVQLVNDPACAALANGYLMPVAKEFTQFISLCWWQGA